MVAFSFSAIGCSHAASPSDTIGTSASALRTDSPLDVLREIIIPCTEDDIRRDFEVFLAPGTTLDTADVFIYGENHIDAEGQSAALRAIQRYGRPGDTYLREGGDRGEKIESCAMLALTGIVAVYKNAESDAEYEPARMFRLHVKIAAAFDDAVKAALKQFPFVVEQMKCEGWDERFHSPARPDESPFDTIRRRNASLIKAIDTALLTGAVHVESGWFHTPSGERRDCFKEMRATMLGDSANDLQTAFGTDSLSAIESSFERYYAAMKQARELATAADLPADSPNVRAQAMARAVHDLGCGTSENVYEFLQTKRSAVFLPPER